MDTCLTLSRIDGSLIPIVAIGGAVVVILVGIICGTLASITKTSAREKSRREMAAYVAEGSMGPDDAERLLMAEPPSESEEA